MEGSLRKPAPIEVVADTNNEKIVPAIPPTKEPAKETPPPVEQPIKVDNNDNCLVCKIVNYSNVALGVSAVFLVWAFIYKLLKTANNG